MSSKADRLRVFLRRLVRLAVVVVLVVGIALLALDLFARFKYRAAERSYLAAGGELELETFVSPLSEGEPNASDLLDAIAATQRYLVDREVAPVGQSDLDPRVICQDAELRGRVERWLEYPANRLALELFGTAPKARRARYVSTHAIATELPSLFSSYAAQRMPAMTLARLLSARSALAAADGRPEDTYADLAGVLTVADWMYQESPGILPWLLATGVANIGLDGLERATSVVPPSAARRAELDGQLEVLTAYRQRGLASEAAYTQRLLRSAHPLGTPVPDAGLGSSLTYFVAGHLGELWAAGFLDLFRVLIERAAEPPTERRPLESLTEETPLYLKPAAIVIPNLYDSITKADELAARIELARIAFDGAELLADQEDEGLRTELRRSVAADPFSGRALLWGGADGCTIYSVGVNGRDDGGTGRSAGSASEADDLTWRLPCRLRELLEQPSAGGPGTGWRR